MQTLLPILFVLLIVSGALGFVLQHRFLSLLHSRHPETWQALGRPDLFRNNSIANGMAVQRFLWRREYRALTDRQFVRFAELVRIYFIAYLLVLLATFAVFIFGRAE